MNARETRDRIQNLFRWTIQLDSRYEFLTYLIAQKSFDNEDRQLQAVPISDIRNQALHEWRNGFASDSSYWMFEVLLEEMIGLGILREGPDKSYAIRTHNLRSLLGNDDDIERRFVDAKSKTAPPVFDPSQFRNELNDGTPSSLSADQENKLLSGRPTVGIVFGTVLAGIDRVGDSLERARERRDGLLPIVRVTPTEMDSALRRGARSRKPGIHVVLVDMRGAKDRAAVDKALAFVAEHEGRNRIVRPVFLCGPTEAWTWWNKPLAVHRNVELREIWLGPCSRDFARIWLKNRQSDTSMDSSGWPVDPPWPVVAKTAAETGQLGSIQDAIDATLEADKDNRYVSDVCVSASTDATLRFLAVLSDEPMTADELLYLLQDVEGAMIPEKIFDFLEWADRLGIVCRDDKGYRLDSTYAAGLGRIFQG